MTSTAPATRKRPRIAALVLNSVSHDARVLKEADSLADAGFDVHILGIRDNRSPDPTTRRESGVTIHRVGLSLMLMGQRYRRMARGALVGSVIALVLAVVVALGSVNSALNTFGAAIYEHMGLFPVLVFLCLLVIVFHLARRYRHFANAARAKFAGARGQERTHRPLMPVVGGFRRVLWHWKNRVIMLAKVVRQFSKFRVVSRLFHAELDRLAPDAVHCHDLPMLPIGAKWCKANPSAFLVFDSHELYEEVSQMSSFMRRVWQRVLRRHAPQVDGFITVNDSIAAEHATRYPALVPAVVVKNATIVTDEPILRTNLLRNAAEIGEDQRVLLYQGGFARHRGLELLIQAAADLPDPWVLVMMGWGNIEGDLKALAANVDPLGKRIRFIPPAPHADLKAWTSGGDLGVIPYENTCLNHWYCSPNKLWEYPIAGLPMLVSPFPELKAVIDAHGVGVCLPEHLDGPGLRGVLADLDDEHVEVMREACARYIEGDHWEVYAKRLVEVYTTRFDGTPATTPSPSLKVEEVEVV